MRQSPNDDRSAIRELTDAWMAAVARQDVAALAALVTEDFETWPAGAPAVSGRAAVEALYRGAFAQVSIEQSFESQEFVVCGDWAFDRGLDTVRMTPRAGGATREHVQRVMLILRRGGDGTWRYARGMSNALPAAPVPAAGEPGAS